MAFVKVNNNFSNINDVINTLTYCDSDESVNVEYGTKRLVHVQITVPIITVDFNNPMEAIRGLLDLMKVYNAGVESERHKKEADKT